MAHLKKKHNIAPLLCYTTFNKLGMTVKGLPSFLNTNQDFEMYIADNDSRDKTWDYLQTLNDPRIREIKRFDRNYGSVNTINWALTHRKAGQAFINVEYDAYNLTPNFVEVFQDIERTFKPGFLHASYIREQKVRYCDIKWSNHLYFARVDEPKCLPMSFCYIPSATLDALGYLCEASYYGDIEFSKRIRQGLKKTTALTFSVQCIHIKDRDEREYRGEGYDCKSCHLYQKVCDRNDAWCVKFRPGSVKTHDRVYPALSTFNKRARSEVVQKRLSGELPLKCGTYHLNQLEPWEDEMRKKNYEFIANYYEKHLGELVCQK